MVNLPNVERIPSIEVVAIAWLAAITQHIFYTRGTFIGYFLSFAGLIMQMLKPLVILRHG